MAATDVDLIEMGDAPIAGGDSDVLELDVHIVFRFDELASVDLPRCDLQGDDMILDDGMEDKVRK